MQHYDALTNSEIDERINENIHNARDRELLRRRLSHSKKGTGRGVHPLPVHFISFWCLVRLMPERYNINHK